MPISRAQRTRIAVTAIVCLAVFLGLQKLRDQRSLSTRPASTPAAKDNERVIRKTTKVRPGLTINVGTPPHDRRNPENGDEDTSTALSGAAGSVVIDDFS